MDTPADRVRQAAEEAQRKKGQDVVDQAHKAIEDARPQKEKDEAKEHDAQVRVLKSREDLGQRAKSSGGKFLARAREIRDQSGWNIHLSLRIEEQYSDPQFFLRIGQPKRGQRGIRGIPTGDGQWQISVYSAIGRPSSTVYYGDDHLEQFRDALLEPLMIEAGAALGAGDEEAGEER